MKVITKAANEQDAYMLRDYLENNGVKVYLQNEGTGDIFNGMPFADIPVAVKDDDYDKAMSLFKQWDDNLSEE